jgi:hypothetical protein
MSSKLGTRRWRLRRRFIFAISARVSPPVRRAPQQSAECCTPRVVRRPGNAPYDRRHPFSCIAAFHCSAMSRTSCGLRHLEQLAADREPGLKSEGCVWRRHLARERYPRRGPAAPTVHARYRGEDHQPVSQEPFPVWWIPRARPCAEAAPADRQSLAKTARGAESRWTRKRVETCSKDSLVQVQLGRLRTGDRADSTVCAGRPSLDH